MTHVWLGEATESTPRAIRLIEELGYDPPLGTKERADWEYVSKPSQTHRPVGPGQPYAELPLNRECSPEEKHLNRMAIFEFFTRAWFRRIWVRQEVALAGSVTIHVGNESCAWDKMMKTAIILHFIADELLIEDFEALRFSGSNYVTSCYELVTGLNSIRIQTGGLQKEYVRFENLVTHARDCESTDPKDKVFAMLPLTNPDKISITPDYRKDMKTIYKAAALTLAQTSFDFLVTCQNPLRDNGLPSWVPDLSIHPNTSKAPLKFFERDSHSGKKAFMDDVPDFQHEPETDTLSISAIIFDNVGVIKDASLLNHGDTEEKDWYNFWRLHRDKSSKPIVGGANFMYHHYDSGIWANEFLREPPLSFLKRNSSDKFVTLTENVDDDPRIRTVKRLLLSNSSESQADSMLNTKLFDAPGSYNTGKAQRLAKERKIMVSQGHTLGLVPSTTLIGDRICRLQGSRYYYIIRNVDKDQYVLVGQVYLLCNPDFRYANDVFQGMIKLT